MPTTRRIPPTLGPRPRGASFSRSFAVVRVTGLVLLFLLPMQMRAGADDPHPHALLHLLLDARDGHLDHHEEVVHAIDSAEHGSEARSHEPDVPTLGAANMAGGAMSMLAALVVVLRWPTARRVVDWPPLGRLVGWAPFLDPPPPRVVNV